MYAQTDHRRREYFLVSNGIQENSGERIRRENIPAMMAAVVVIFRSLNRAVFDLPQ